MVHQQHPPQRVTSPSLSTMIQHLVALDIGILCQCMVQVLLHIECCTRGAPLVLFLCFSGWEVLFELGSTSLRHLYFSSIHLSRQPQQVLARATTQSREGTANFSSQGHM